MRFTTFALIYNANESSLELETISIVNSVKLGEGEGNFDDSVIDIEYDSSMDSATDPDIDPQQFTLALVESTDSGLLSLLLLLNFVLTQLFL